MTIESLSILHCKSPWEESRYRRLFSSLSSNHDQGKHNHCVLNYTHGIFVPFKICGADAPPRARSDYQRCFDHSATAVKSHFNLHRSFFCVKLQFPCYLNLRCVTKTLEFSLALISSLVLVRMLSHHSLCG